MQKNRFSLLMLASLLVLSGCAATKKDYSDFRATNPKTILVLPPKNSSPDTKATYGVYASATRPIAESGFYVLPVTLVDEHFKSNGLTVVDDIHLVDSAKLREVFGADAALYINVLEYGTKYYVVGSAAIVKAEAKLVDLKTGKVLWENTATASSEEGQNNNQAGLAGLLISAIVKQVLGTVMDQSKDVAKLTNARLLDAQVPNGLLYGPRHPQYQQ